MDEAIILSSARFLVDMIFVPATHSNNDCWLGSHLVRNVDVHVYLCWIISEVLHLYK